MPEKLKNMPFSEFPNIGLWTIEGWVELPLLENPNNPPLLSANSMKTNISSNNIV